MGLLALGLGLVVEDKPTELLCVQVHNIYVMFVKVHVDV